MREVVPPCSHPPLIQELYGRSIRGRRTNVNRLATSQHRVGAGHHADRPLVRGAHHHHAAEAGGAADPHDARVAHAFGEGRNGGDGLPLHDPSIEPVDALRQVDDWPAPFVAARL